MGEQQLLTIPASTSSPAPASRRKAQGLGMLAAGLAISGVCLYLAMRNTDLRAVTDILAHANLWLVPPVIAAQVLFYALKAARWRLLLLPVKSVPTARLAAPMMIGFMGNYVLPARLGELIRVHLGARLLRIAHSRVLATVLLERLFDFIAVLTLFGIGGLLLEGIPERLISAGYVAGITAAAAMIGAVACTRLSDPATTSRRIVSMLPRAAGVRIAAQIELGVSGLGSLRRPRLVALIVIASLLQWALMAACIYLSCYAVGLDVPRSAALVVLAATVFGVMLPAAPGFFGTLHLAFMFALSPFQVDQGLAMSAAVFYHIVPYVCVIVSGAWFARQTGIRLNDLRREAVDGPPAGHAAIVVVS